MRKRGTGASAEPRFSEVELLNYAGRAGFARGEEYVRYVHGLRVEGSRATASIQAKRVYQVELDWSEPNLAGSCTCPHYADGAFCKHLVALGLAVLDQGGTHADEPGAVDSYLDALDPDALRELARELAARDPGVERLLQTRAAMTTGADGEAAKSLVAMVNETLRTRGFVDYRRSFDVARDAQELLDGLERHLDAGAAEVVRPALLRALTRLRKITETADDSGGVLGTACQRAADLHARACREGNPDPVKLGRWLAKFRDESPGWPETPLADYAPALGERGVAAYRAAVAALDEKYADRDEWKRFEIDRMLLELADHDGDVDRAIELLSRRQHPALGAIVARLRRAGRDAEVIEWIDRAVAADRVSGQLGAQGGDYWLDPAEVAEEYLAVGRDDDAVTVLRKNFARWPGFRTFELLLRYAERLGRVDTERAWAIATATEQAARPHGDGAALVEIALGEKDLDAAWAAAERFGAGQMWRRLADASRDTRPRAAADLYRPEVESALQVADTRKYRDVAKLLATMRDLYAKAGDDAEFAAYVADIKATYARRPSLMAELTKAGL